MGTIKSTPGTNANPTGISMTILEGSSSGVSWFDPELGISIDATINQDIKIIMTMPMNARTNDEAGRMMTMTNIMSQAITVKLDSVR